MIFGEILYISEPFVYVYVTVEGSITHRINPLAPVASSGVPKTALRLNNSLGILREFSKSCFMTVMGYYI